MQRLCERLRYVRSALIEHLDEGNPEVIHFKVHVPHTCLTSALNTSTVTESLSLGGCPRRTGCGAADFDGTVRRVNPAAP
jgi:hypothetical protein